MGPVWWRALWVMVFSKPGLPSWLILVLPRKVLLWGQRQTLPSLNDCSLLLSSFTKELFRFCSFSCCMIEKFPRAAFEGDCPTIRLQRCMGLFISTAKKSEQGQYQGIGIVNRDTLATVPVVHPQLLVLPEELVLFLFSLCKVLLQLVLVAEDDVLFSVPLCPFLLVFEEHVAFLLLTFLQLVLNLLDLFLEHAAFFVQHFLVLDHFAVPFVFEGLDLGEVLLFLFNQVVDLLLVLGEGADLALGFKDQFVVELLDLLVHALDPVFVVSLLLVVVVFHVPEPELELVLLLLLHLIDVVVEGLRVLAVHLGRQVLKSQFELLLVLLQLLLELAVLLFQELLLVLPQHQVTLVVAVHLLPAVLQFLQLVLQLVHYLSLLRRARRESHLQFLNLLGEADVFLSEAFLELVLLDFQVGELLLDDSLVLFEQGQLATALEVFVLLLLLVGVQLVLHCLLVFIDLLDPLFSLFHEVLLEVLDAFLVLGLVLLQALHRLLVLLVHELLLLGQQRNLLLELHLLLHVLVGQVLVLLPDFVQTLLQGLFVFQQFPLNLLVLLLFPLQLRLHLFLLVLKAQVTLVPFAQLVLGGLQLFSQHLEFQVELLCNLVMDLLAVVLFAGELFLQLLQVLLLVDQLLLLKLQVVVLLAFQVGQLLFQYEVVVLENLHFIIKVELVLPHLLFVLVDQVSQLLVVLLLLLVQLLLQPLLLQFVERLQLAQLFFRPDFVFLLFTMQFLLVLVNLLFQLADLVVVAGLLLFDHLLLVLVELLDGLLVLFVLPESLLQPFSQLFVLLELLVQLALVLKFQVAVLLSHGLQFFGEAFAVVLPLLLHAVHLILVLLLDFLELAGVVLLAVGLEGLDHVVVGLLLLSHLLLQRVHLHFQELVLLLQDGLVLVRLDLGGLQRLAPLLQVHLQGLHLLSQLLLPDLAALVVEFQVLLLVGLEFLEFGTHVVHGLVGLVVGLLQLGLHQRPLLPLHVEGVFLSGEVVLEFEHLLIEGVDLGLLGPAVGLLLAQVVLHLGLVVPFVVLKLVTHLLVLLGEFFVGLLQVRHLLIVQGQGLVELTLLHQQGTLHLLAVVVLLQQLLLDLTQFLLRPPPFLVDLLLQVVLLSLFLLNDLLHLLLHVVLPVLYLALFAFELGDLDHHAALGVLYLGPGVIDLLLHLSLLGLVVLLLHLELP